MSKGSRYRPVDKKTFESNFDKINWDRKIEPTKKKSKPKRRSHHIMPDIEPYRAVAGDMAGKWITSRSQEREYLKRNGFVQVGNEKEYFFKHNGKTPDNPTRLWNKK